MQEFNSALLRFNADVVEVGKSIRYIADGSSRITFGLNTEGNYIVGNPKKTGAYKIEIDGDDLVFYRKESGSYIEKFRING